jgi:sterol desaturase/sphingolipid hydroxylase (fatty acid hydroxylase superfamily)
MPIWKFDVTTGVRFHPLEILVSMGFKIAVVVALGPPAIAVMIFEVLLNATSMFSCGNVRLSQRLDGLLRWLVVTPDMHRVHHSILPHETKAISASIFRGGIACPIGQHPRVVTSG